MPAAELIRSRPFVCRASSIDKESESLFDNVLQDLSHRQALMATPGKEGLDTEQVHQII